MPCNYLQSFMSLKQLDADFSELFALGLESTLTALKQRA